MRARQLNAYDREQLRRARSETRLILACCRARGFEYVVNPQELVKVAFGTTMHREVMPTSGPAMSSFMRSHMVEGRDHPSPLDYDCAKPMGFKYPSKAGFSSLANKTPRLPATRDQVVPPVGSYEPSPWKLRAGYTFDKSVESKPNWMTPGPSTYTCHKVYPDWRVETAFGSRRIIWPSVAVFCGPNNMAQCVNCHQRPLGDYFHNFVLDKDMCRKCMKSEMDVIKNCSLSVTERYRRRLDIKLFMPARYCGFFHSHEGTTAAVELTSRKELRDKIRVENYLYRYENKVE